MKHKCKQLDYCICDISALEPNENCPVHAAGIYPPRCVICGRFMKIKNNGIREVERVIKKFCKREDKWDRESGKISVGQY